MLLNDVAVPLARGRSAARLRRHAELSLFTVNFERHDANSRYYGVFGPSQHFCGDFVTATTKIKKTLPVASVP
jgi:hypothetical protein